MITKQHTSTSDITPQRHLVHRNVSLTLIAVDVVAIALSLIFAKKTILAIKHVLYFEDFNDPFIQYIYPHDLLFAIICPFVLFFFLIRGHYTQRVPWWSQVQNILNACIIAFIFDGFSRFALDMSVSRLMISLSWVYLFFLILLGRRIAFMYLKRQKIWDMPAVAIGNIDTVTDLLFAFHTDNYTGYDIKTVLLRNKSNDTFNLSELPSRYENITVIMDEQDYSKFIEEHLDKFFVVSLETFRGSDRDNIINALTLSKALYAIVPPTSRTNSYEMEPRYFFGYDIMLMHIRNPMFSPLGRILKRGMDVCVAGLALLLLSPVILLISLCLKLEGQGGTVFYGGKRIGRYGKEFNCWKFRSMEPDSDHLLHELLEKDPQAKTDWELYRKLKQRDPRVTTHTARIIRKASLDELPQLWNVLTGEMSLVGPRPILSDEIPLFGDKISEYLRVRPGITGLWQVSGRNDTTFQRRVNWDSWYVRNWSLWGDIVILIKTLGVVFARQGAF